MNTDKLWKRIVTHWHLMVNSLFAVLFTLNLSGVIASLPSIQPYLPAHWFKTITAVFIGVNILLGFFKNNEAVFQRSQPGPDQKGPQP